MHLLLSSKNTAFASLFQFRIITDPTGCPLVALYKNRTFPPGGGNVLLGKFWEVIPKLYFYANTEIVCAVEDMGGPICIVQSDFSTTAFLYGSHDRKTGSET